MGDFNKKNELRELLNQVVNQKPDIANNLIEILNPEGFGIKNINGELRIEGGVINKLAPIFNEAHFQDIQNRIIEALDSAEVSIIVVMAWFTNGTLFQKLVEKYKQGIDVKLAIFDDGINKKHGVDITQLPQVTKIRSKKGGLMHNKFCVVDNQVLITGSYNWSDNAEFRNDENVTVEHDPKQATRYSVEFRRLTK